RFVDKGGWTWQATLKCARPIGFTVISIRISIDAVFIPLLFMSGWIGRLFHGFAVTLSAAILVSGVVSLTLTPMLCGRFLKSENPGKKRGVLYRASERGFDAMHDFYTRTLKWVLRHEYLMLVVTGAVLVATVWLYFVVPKGFFPPQDTGQLMGAKDAA